MLPEGIRTPEHRLRCLTDKTETDVKHVGYLWYKPCPAMHSVFIYDFHIFSAFQGRGLGKEALRIFEDSLREQGVEQIRLRVAGDNVRAAQLYIKSGFDVTGINMSKNLLA